MDSKWSRYKIASYLGRHTTVHILGIRLEQQAKIGIIISKEMATKQSFPPHKVNMAFVFLQNSFTSSFYVIILVIYSLCCCHILHICHHELALLVSN